ncbi:hypothetical protein SEMRO_407_G136520.1 [Seminavis robusta]|uniref:Uncharacterized protein n=1 Tax=Seminavis robusta TaxID=568900 RepID=A0A9N8E195_9STRA|nr:hypothetical protein SEMRO_407_G136520.1 [Seminavis robusta]|eukprot:Sro407_g136520.1 n/a (511) ;mRNA; f:2786-4392
MPTTRAKAKKGRAAAAQRVPKQEDPKEEELSRSRRDSYTSSEGSSVARPVLGSSQLGSPAGSVRSIGSRRINPTRTNAAGLSHELQVQLASDVERSGGIVAVCERKNGILALCRANTDAYGENNQKKRRQQVRNRIKYWEKLHKAGTGYIDLLDTWQVYISEPTRRYHLEGERKPAAQARVPDTIQVSRDDTSSIGTAETTSIDFTPSSDPISSGFEIPTAPLSFQAFAATSIFEPISTMSGIRGTYRSGEPHGGGEAGGLTQIIPVNTKYLERTPDPIKVMKVRGLQGVEKNDLYDGYVINLRLIDIRDLLGHGEDKPNPDHFQAKLISMGGPGSGAKISIAVPALDWHFSGKDDDKVKEVLHGDQNSGIRDKLDTVYHEFTNDPIRKSNQKHLILEFPPGLSLCSDVLLCNKDTADPKTDLDLEVLPVFTDCSGLEAPPDKWEQGTDTNGNTISILTRTVLKFPAFRLQWRVAIKAEAIKRGRGEKKKQTQTAGQAAFLKSMQNMTTG